MIFWIMDLFHKITIVSEYFQKAKIIKFWNSDVVRIPKKNLINDEFFES